MTDMPDLQKLSDLDKSLPDCILCEGDGWVCENHPHTAWNGGSGCECGGAGAPCVCNKLFMLQFGDRNADKS